MTPLKCKVISLLIIGIHKLWTVWFYLHCSRTWCSRSYYLRSWSSTECKNAMIFIEAWIDWHWVAKQELHSCHAFPGISRFYDIYSCAVTPNHRGHISLSAFICSLTILFLSVTFCFLLITIRRHLCRQRWFNGKRKDCKILWWKTVKWLTESFCSNYTVNNNYDRSNVILQ